MLITVPSFDVKDKSVSEIKEEAVARLRYLSDKVGADMKISLGVLWCTELLHQPVWNSL